LTGQECQRSAVYGMNKCVRHGGGKPLKGKPRGWQNFKSGANSKFLVFRFAGQIIEGKVPDTKRYEKFIPKRLAEKYLESVNDPEIIALNDDIALIETRIKQLIDNIDKDEPPPVWDEVNEVFVNFLMYDRLGDTIKRAEALLLLTLMFDREKSERKAWDEIFERLGQVARFRSEERKRRMDMKSLLDAEKAMDMVSNLLAAVHEAAEEVLEDEETINRLYLATGQRFVRITGSGDSAVLEAVGSGKQRVARPSGLD
jgi:hypothetical protein